MSTLNKVDPSTLGWVKTEIDETLKQARLALEAYTDNSADESQLRFCATYLHQVLGTLQMVELDGAAMLARETEQLAEALLGGSVAADPVVVDTLIRGILTLPDYLARLQIGQPDAPLRLLSLLNELRVGRGAEPLNGYELFNPDLDVRPPKREGAVRQSEPDYAVTTKSLRPAFQATLLNWLRDTGNSRHLNDLSSLIERLQYEAPLPLLEQLFWVSRGYLDALASGAVAINNDRKKLLARLEQQLKKIAVGSDRSLLRNTSEALIKAMLYEIGYAHAATRHAAEVRRAFALDALIPGETETGFTMPTPEAMESVSEALGKEIGQAQDLMTSYFENGDQATLESLITLLHRMSGTLEMIGVEVLKALVDEVAGLCQQLQRNELERSDDLALPMAKALLQVENSTRNIQTLGADWKQHIEDQIAGLRRLRAGEDTTGIEISDAELSDTEFRQLVGVVGGEIRVNLGKIEEALETFAADPGQTGLLDSLLPYLSQIQGALQILGQDRAADLIATTQQHVQDLRDGRLNADSALLDAFAVAVGTIGAYIEGLERDRPNLEPLLSTARRDLAAALTGKRTQSGDPEALLGTIEQNLTAWLADHDDRAALAALTQDLRDITWLAESQRQERIAKICEQMTALLEMVDLGEPSDEIEDTLRQSYDALVQLVRANLHTQELARSAPRPSSKAKAQNVAPPILSAAPAAPVAPAPPVAQAHVQPVAKPAPPRVSKPVAPALEVDDDIIQIFIEDAREMIALINKTLPDWHADSTNRDVLLDLRRAFHTLKGSGRMVGASDISEFAWAVENMLNRVRENKVEPSPPMFDLLYQARAVLPEMVAQLEGGPVPEADVMQLRAVADALAEGREPPPMQEMVPPSAENIFQNAKINPEPTKLEVDALAEPQAENDAAPLPALDTTLLQIFGNETRGHVANVRNEIEKCRAGGLACHPSDSLVRAVHTLQGSARAVGLPFMAEASGELERLLHDRQTHQHSLAQEDFGLFESHMTAVEQLIDLLQRNETHAPDLLREFARIAAAAIAAHAPVAHDVSKAAGPKPAPAKPVPPPAPVVHEPEHPVTPPPVARAPAAPPPRAPAPVAAAPVAADGDIVVDEQHDPELTEIFLEEATDILAAIEESLTRWRGDREDRAAINELKRQLHTLKGGARMAGAMTMGNLGHQTESLLGEIEGGRATADTELMDLMDEVHDALVSMVHQMQEHKPVRTYAQVTNKVLSRLGMPLLNVSAPSVASAPTSIPVEQPLVPPAILSVPEPDEIVIPEPVAPIPVAAVLQAEAPIPPPVVAPVEMHVADSTTSTDMFAPHIDRRHETEEQGEVIPGTERRDQIRVRTGLLNELVNFAGEVSISRSRMEQQIFGLRENLAELNRNTMRFRDQIRELEIQSESQILARAQAEASRAGEDFDPLEFDRFSRLQTLSRSLAESLHDLFTIRGNLENYASQAEGVLQQQARINTDLQEGLMRTRMISFATQGARLRHIVRQTAREVGKRVELDIIGSDVEVDRTVLERMIGPFEHMIRNAIDHGIESESERKRAGKPSAGRITITTANEGSEVVIRFADDGGGLNTAAIRRKAVERGMIKASANLSDDELIQFILMPGFSTAEKVTQLSGRGVGMDVVHSEVKQLGGSITVDTAQGQGTTFIVRLPLTLSISQALMLRVGDQLFALPISAVVNILEVPVSSLNTIHVGTRPLFNWEDQVFPFMHLATRLGIHSPLPDGKKVPVLLARSGGRQVAIQVEGMAGTREIVIKPLGAQLAGIEGLAGATILGDGSVVLILDVPGLWLTEEGMQVSHEGGHARPAASGEEALAPAAVDVERMPEKPVAPVVPAAPVRDRAVVMVVDDSITVRKVTQRHLGKAGMDVLLAKDGVDALEQLRENVPDVMLVDIEMPRMDGYELTQHVRNDSRTRDVPIIMITSRAGEKHREKALSLGVNVYMTKPYQEDALIEQIKSLLPANLVS